VLGGEHGHIPLEVGAGELVAKMVVTERVSLVLDLSQFRKHEVSTFMTAFMENLYRLKAQEQYRTPMMLIIDEADAIAPQKPQRGEERMLGAAEDLVRRGGQRGIGVTMITQRSAVLNKNVLTQIGILIVLRTIAPQDIKAMKAWIDLHGTEAQGAALIESLPALPTGTGWVWAPGWPDKDGIFDKYRFLLPETFDSSKTPGQSKAVVPKNAADVDLAAFQKEMAATIEKAKQDDPRELRKQLTEATTMLARQSKTIGALQARTSAGREKRVEVPVVPDAQIDRLLKRLETALEKYQHAVHPTQLLQDALANLTTAVQRMTTARTPVPTPAPAPTRHIESTLNPRRIPPAPRTARPVIDTNGHLSKGEKATLIAAVQYPDGLTREQATILTGYKRSTRDAYIQRLVTKGFVEVRGSDVCPTDAGISALGANYEPLPTGDALQAYWLNRLPSGEKAVLDFALQVYPKELDRDTIDEATGFKRSTRDAYIQRLMARKLVTAGRGTVRASDVLFEG